jgi:hypothetical protein
MEAPQNTKNRTIIRFSYHTPAIYTKECKPAYNGDQCTRALFTRAELWSQLGSLS